MRGERLSAPPFFVDNSLLYCRQGYMPPAKALKKMAPPPMKTST